MKALWLPLATIILCILVSMLVFGQESKKLEKNDVAQSV